MSKYTEAYDLAISRGNSQLVSEAIALTISSRNTPNFVRLNITPQTNQIVFNAKGKEITFEGILADQGQFIQSLLPYKVMNFTEEALKDIAEQINSFGSTAPDVDHEVGERLSKMYGSNTNLIMNAIPQYKGMLKNIQAVYSDGKLWIKGTLDEKYRSILPHVKGLSIEAMTESISNTNITKSKYLGFTLAVNKMPKMAIARITNYA